MNKRLMKEFEQQFSGHWTCACQTPLDPARFEVLSETQTSILVHYSCPVCGKEQMLAAAVASEGTIPLTSDLEAYEVKEFFNRAAVSSDDVLDIREEVKEFSPRNFKSLLKKPRGSTVSSNLLLSKQD